MVIDCAKGVEERTIKLMEVCRLRDTPIMTFINKLDRDGRAADRAARRDREGAAASRTAPVTWPIGMGRELRGIYHLLEDRIYVYAAGRARPAWARTAPSTDLRSAAAREFLGDRRRRVRRGDRAGAAAPPQALRPRRPTAPAGRRRCSSARRSTTSASRSCSRRSPRTRPGPLPRAARERSVRAAERRRSPASCSRSRPTWIRRTATASRSCACARGATRAACASIHVRLGKEVRVADALTFMAAERAQAEEAFAGDIIGLHNHGTINIGDTFTQGERLTFTGVPELRARRSSAAPCSRTRCGPRRCRRGWRSCARRAPRSCSGRCATTS